MAEETTRRGAFGEEPTVDLDELRARTVAESEAVYCVCHHTEGAHKAGTVRPCAFCRCKDFQVPSLFADLDDAPKLPPAGQRALTILAQTDAFKGVPNSGLRVLAKQATRRLFLPGRDIMVQGDASQSLHIIVKGTVRVERRTVGGQPQILAELGEGEVVGEMGVLDGSPRSATVTTTSDVETLELTAPVMKETFQQFPQALMAVLKMVTERMRNTDALVETTLQIALEQLDTEKDA